MCQIVIGIGNYLKIIEEGIKNNWYENIRDRESIKEDLKKIKEKYFIYKRYYKDKAWNKSYRLYCFKSAIKYKKYIKYFENKLKEDK